MKVKGGGARFKSKEGKRREAKGAMGMIKEEKKLALNLTQQQCSLYKNIFLNKLIFSTAGNIFAL